MKATQYLKLSAILIGVLIAIQPLVHAETLNLVYDANGNLISGDNKYREYNSLNQLIRVRNGSTASDPILEEYIHDPIEEKIAVKKVYDNGQLLETVYYYGEDYVRVINASSDAVDTEYVHLNGQLVAQINDDGTKQYVHDDHIGSTSVVTDESGNVKEITTYSPFGEVLTGGRETRYGYEGKEHSTGYGDIPTDSLISYYSLEGNADDDTGNNDGTVSGASRTEGKVRDGYSFDGNADGISLDSAYVFTQNNTMSFWAKINPDDNLGVVAGDLGWFAYLRFGQASGTYDNTLFGETNTDGDTISLDFKGAFDTINKDEWYHFAVTLDDSKKFRLYINGVYQSSYTVSNANLTISVIGKGRDNIDWFNGSIDEFSLWNRTLTTDEITNIYEHGSKFDSSYREVDFKFRKYNPEWGLFTQPDTLIQNVYDPQTLNRYMFERANPYKYTDPDGHILVVDDAIVLTVVTYAAIASLAAYVGLVVVPAIDKIRPDIQKAAYETARDYIEYKRRANDLKSLVESGYDVGAGLYEGDMDRVLKGAKGFAASALDQVIGTELGMATKSAIPHDYYLAQDYTLGNIIVNGLHRSMDIFFDSFGSKSSTIGTIGVGGGGRSRRRTSYRIDRDDGETTGGSIAGFEMSEGFAKKFEQALKEHPDYFK